MDCIHTNGPKEMLEIWQSHKDNFSGLEETEVITLLCSAAVGAGDALYEEFATLLPEEIRPQIEEVKDMCQKETRKKYYGY
ncbi:uncharacterized protein LOC144178078 isoform X2 [Haemaphysalis longicornis]